MPAKRPAPKPTKKGPAPPPEITPEDRAYYREMWGFDPVTDRVDVGNGKFRYEAWFALSSDPGLAAAGVEAGAQVDFAARGGQVHNRIVFRRAGQEATVDCTHTVALAGPAQDAMTLASDLLVRHGALEPESKKLLQAAGGPVVLPPAEHFAALKSYVAAVADAGIGNMLRAAWGTFLAIGERSPGDATELPFGFNSAMQAQVIRVLQDVAMAAWEGILTDWVAEMLDTATPAELVALREPLNQMLTGADFEKIFRDANLPPEEEDDERAAWVQEPTEEGPLGERFAYRGHAIGLARVLELLWQRADRDWWAAHRRQVEALFNDRREAVGRSFAPSAVIRSTGERVVVDEGGKLDLSHQGIASLADVDFSGCAGAVKILNLRQNEIQKIENLHALRGIEELHLDEDKIAAIENLEPIAPTLRVFSLHNNNISKIGSLNALTSLKMLAISGNRLTRIEGLDGLNNLEQLNLSGNQIPKIEGLDHLPALRDLAIDNNRITKIENLDPLNNLVRLSLNGNQLTNIDNLGNLDELQSLNLKNNLITNLEELKIARNLRLLNVSENRLKELPVLNTLNSLENLYLASNEIKEVDGSKLPIHLQVLDVQRNSIEEVKTLTHLKELKIMWIGNNRLKSLAGMGMLSDLHSLDAENNQFCLLSDFPVCLPNVLDLNIAGNPLKNIDPLVELKKLKNLDLSSIILNDITPLASLANLEALTLDNSTIPSLAPCAKLPKLKWVNLRGTRVADLEKREDKFLMGLKRPDGSLPLDVIGWRVYY